MAHSVLTPDPWQHLQRLTPARIALGRAGGSLPSKEVLRFAMDHALARDAVWTELDVPALERDLQPLGLPIVAAASQATDRATYLKRPDLGRRLDESSVQGIAESIPPNTTFDVSLTIADGLSALAAQRQSPPLLAALVPLLRNAGLSLAPLVIVRQGRVAIQDEVGSAVRARCSVVLIGERPGLGTPDSLGAYLVFNPKPGNTDANRNCVSNIRPAGLPPKAAADTLHYLITQSLAKQLSGVQLKDDRMLMRSSAPGALTGVPSEPR
jgi:ethanolamine ammonia-lyase small subunit